MEEILEDNTTGGSHGALAHWLEKTEWGNTKIHDSN